MCQSVIRTDQTGYSFSCMGTHLCITTVLPTMYIFNYQCIILVTLQVSFHNHLKKIFNKYYITLYPTCVLCNEVGVLRYVWFNIESTKNGQVIFWASESWRSDGVIW